MGSLVLTSLVFLLAVISSVTQAQDCPGGFDHCEVNPCAFTLCQVGSDCVPKFCGSCEAKCVPACIERRCRRRCPGGFVVDENGCQTCRCRKKCENVKQCRKDEFCNGDCCPNAVLTQRCVDLCPTTTCFGSNTCEMYCNCFASCVP